MTCGVDMETITDQLKCPWQWRQPSQRPPKGSTLLSTDLGEECLEVSQVIGKDESHRIQEEIRRLAQLKELRREATNWNGAFDPILDQELDNNESYQEIFASLFSNTFEDLCRAEEKASKDDEVNSLLAVDEDEANDEADDDDDSQSCSSSTHSLSSSEDSSPSAPSTPIDALTILADVEDDDEDIFVKIARELVYDEDSLKSITLPDCDILVEVTSKESTRNGEFRLPPSAFCGSPYVGGVKRALTLMSDDDMDYLSLDETSAPPRKRAHTIFGHTK